MAAIGTPENPLRVAIVGSGPSGFYAAGHLLKSKSHPDLAAEVDVFDRLPTSGGSCAAASPWTIPTSRRSRACMRRPPRTPSSASTATSSSAATSATTT